MVRAIAVALVLLLTASAAAAQNVFLVRHAERADGGAGAAGSGADPELSAAGVSRADALATALKDAGLTAIFVTEFKRTQQTAAPLAKALGLTPTVVPAKDVAGLAARVRAASGGVLVVGHSNTVPDVIKSLGVETPVTIADADYDNLFVVRLGEKTSMIRLHYR